MLPTGGSAVGFAAVADSKDTYRVGVQVEADAVVADAETVFRRLNPLQAPDIAGAGGGEAFDALLDAPCDASVERGHIGKGRLGPFDLAH